MFKCGEDSSVTEADGVTRPATANPNSSRGMESFGEMPSLPPIDESHLPPDDRSFHEMIGLGWTVQDENKDRASFCNEGEACPAAVSSRRSDGTSRDRQTQVGKSRRPSVKEGWVVETLFELKNTAPSAVETSTNNQSEAIKSPNKADISCPAGKTGTRKSSMIEGETSIVEKKSETTWNQRLNELLEFKAQHGHCNVPQKYEKNTSLGAWVARNRLFMRQWESNPLCCSPYQAERMQTLKDMGLLSSIGEQYIRFSYSKCFQKP